MAITALAEECPICLHGCSVGTLVRHFMGGRTLQFSVGCPEKTVRIMAARTYTCISESDAVPGRRLFLFTVAHLLNTSLKLAAKVFRATAVQDHQQP